MPKKTVYQSDELAYLRDEAAATRPEHELYQALSADEDKERTNRIYEVDPEFFILFTGGDWNTFSCDLWTEGAADAASSQAAKLDLLASYMKLKPGMRILDVGCGWGGPLTYLTTQYGVSGVGLTLSQVQKNYADARIARHKADVQINICHWKDFHDEQGFDVIYTDEVIVHFHDLVDYFRKVHYLLKPGGIMLNKEVHYTRKAPLQSLTRGEVHINEIYGFTGNYRTLYDELAMVDEAGFELIWHHQIDGENYKRTLDSWLSHMHQHKARMVEVSSEEYWRNFRIHLKLVRAGFNSTIPTVDVIVSRKVED
jgi:cyclopropane-fatty-acyl-phospholipid synthase